MTRVYRTIRNALAALALAAASTGGAQASPIDVTFDNTGYCQRHPTTNHH